MKIVDPHVHFWNTDAVRYPWLEAREVAYSGDNRLLPKRFLFDNLTSGECGIEVLGTVHVEANPEDPTAEARWLQSLASDPVQRGHPNAIVAGIDLSRADALRSMDVLSEIPNLRGVRQILNRHVDPRYNYAHRDYLDESTWLYNLGRLAEYGWSFDLQLYPRQARAAAAVIGENPDILFVINHSGMFVDRVLSGWTEWRGAMRIYAGFSNVAVKVSGLAMFDHEWTVDSFRPIVLETLDAFGPNRCMFASNFPIDGLHASYRRLWTAYAEIVGDLSANEKDALFVKNAIRFYRLSLP